VCDWKCDPNFSMVDDKCVSDGLKVHYTFDNTLADKLHIATYELSQAINRKTGYNFNSFVNYHRIQKAKGILKNPDNNYKSILEVSFEVGFNSKVSFNRAFKIFENTTPLKFRKNL